jgi:hypothetical protein
MGRSYVSFYCVFLLFLVLSALFLNELGRFFYSSLAGYIAYSSLLIWFLIPFIKRKLPIRIGRSLFIKWEIVEGWEAALLSLVFLVPLVAIGVVVEFYFPVNIYAFLASCLIGGGVSYWFFSKAITVTPF